MNARSARQRKNARAIGATLLVAAAIALVAWRWAPGAETPAPPTTVASPEDMIAREPAIQQTPDLVQVGDPGGPGVLAAANAARTAGSAIHKKAATRTTAEEKPKAKRKKADKEKAQGDPEEVEYKLIIQPAIDIHHIVDLDASSVMVLSAEATGRRKRASVTSFLGQKPSLTLGSATDTKNVAVLLTVDHPDAMPTVVEIRPSQWGFDGAVFSVSPTVALAPMDGRLVLSRRLPESIRSVTNARQFDGHCALVTIDHWGNVLVMDQVDLSGRKSGRPAKLRFVKTTGRTFILGTPAAAYAAGDVIEVTGQLKKADDLRQTQSLPTTLRGLRLPRLQFTVLDPFDEPVKGARIVGTVRSTAIQLFDQDGAPVRHEGFVFVTGSSKGSYVGGQRLDGDVVRPSPLALARMGAEAKTAADGKAQLDGLHVGVHEFSVRSRFGTVVPLENPVQAITSPQLVRSPVVGLEVFCPADWQKTKEGRDAWARAKVKISGKSRALPFKPNAGSDTRPRRFLVPPDVAMTITCTAKGRPVATAKFGPQPARSRGAAFPKAPKAAKKAP